MPSHVTHLLFAEDVARRLGHMELTQGKLRPFLTLGAQGPDIFYHNQRSRPTGLAYGSLMHRHGYGSVSSWMWHWATSQHVELESWAGAWVFGFVTHAIVDRFTHPFINYFSGWVDPEDPDSQRYRSMHPFLERLIDVELLAEQTGRHPNEIGFFSSVDCGEEPPGELIEMFASALSNSYPKASRDTLLHQRLQNAYLDSRGYYRFTDFVDETYLTQGLAREQRGEIGGRWITIIHPPGIPEGLDPLNRQRREWCHPCNHTEIHHESFVELYQNALDHAVEVLEVVVDTWGHHADEEHRQLIQDAVCEWNLSDGRDTEHPCKKRHADPLPLPEAIDQIKKSIRSGQG